MVGEVITLEKADPCPLFCQFHPVAFVSLWRTSGYTAAQVWWSICWGSCLSMRRLLVFLSQLILLWDPQIHFLTISSLCFEFSVAQKQFPAENLSAPIDIGGHWTGLKFPSFLQRPGVALPFPCDSQIRCEQIYLFQIYLFRRPLCFYSVN